MDSILIGLDRDFSSDYGCYAPTNGAPLDEDAVLQRRSRSAGSAERSARLYRLQHYADAPLKSSGRDAHGLASSDGATAWRVIPAAGPHWARAVMIRRIRHRPAPAAQSCQRMTGATQDRVEQQFRARSSAPSGARVCRERQRPRRSQSKSQILDLNGRRAARQIECKDQPFFCHWKSEGITRCAFTKTIDRIRIHRDIYLVEASVRRLCDERVGAEMYRNQAARTIGAFPWRIRYEPTFRRLKGRFRR